MELLLFKLFLKPLLSILKEKIDSGEIDPIKGSDLDREILDKVIDAISSSL